MCRVLGSAAEGVASSDRSRAHRVGAQLGIRRANRETRLRSCEGPPIPRC